MPWIKLDDQYPDHPKVRLVGAIGLAIQTAAICYCGRYLTDGFVSFSAADAIIRSVLSPITREDGSIWSLCLTSGMAGEDAEETDWKIVMVEAKLWEKSDGGFIVHDYLEYNPSKREFNQLLKSKRLAGQAGGQASAKARGYTGDQRIGQQAIKRNPTPSPSPSREEKDPPIVPQGDDGFERFWSTYPRKVGKGAARKVWERIHPSDGILEAILAAVNVQSTSDQWAKDGGQFIPHPATWLHQERWQDEATVPATPPTPIPEDHKTEWSSFEAYRSAHKAWRIPPTRRVPEWDQRIQDEPKA